MFEGSLHLPLKLNTSGVRRSLLVAAVLPTTVANFNAGSGPGWLTTVTMLFGHGRPLFLFFTSR